MKTEYKIALLSAVLAFVGAIGGTVLTGLYQTREWERNSRYEMERMILERRMNVMEKTCKLLNQAPVIDLWETEYDVREKNAQLAAEFADAQLRHRTSAKQPIDSEANFVKAMALRQKMLQLNAENLATLQLARMLFGPKTEKACAALVKDRHWYKGDEKEQEKDALLDAMADEMAYRIDCLNLLKLEDSEAAEPKRMMRQNKRPKD